MGDADAGALLLLRRPGLPGLLGEAGYLADRLHGDQPVARLQGQAGGVITPIFQPLETGEEDGDGGRAADVTDDAAHGLRR